MKLVIAVALGTLLIVAAASGEQQRILRRVIKSTPTASNLARVRLVTVRSAGAERGAVSEISSQQAANFGQRAANETSSGQQQQIPTSTKTKVHPSTTTSSPTTSTSTTITTTTTSPAAPTTAATTSSSSSSSSSTTTTTSAGAPLATVSQIKPKASERQQAAEVELMASAPSSWQTMTAVEAPAAALIAVGTRPAQVAGVSQDLSSSSSEESNDFLRAGSSSKTSYSSAGETFSRLRQQSSKTSQQQQQQQQQSFFYPQQQQQRAQSKTSNYQQATKTHWYQAPTTSTTPRPAPIIQEQQYEQYVEQQQVEAAPPGLAEPFAFDFNTQDNSGNGQYRKEESDKNGVVRGSYGYTDANGIYRHVEYVADHNGFRANIKSNEPGLIGETQPASIRLDGGPAPATSQRFTASNSVGNSENTDWTASSSSSNERADLALAPPDFESAHKSERLRAPRQFRN